MPTVTIKDTLRAGLKANLGIDPTDLENTLAKFITDATGGVLPMKNGIPCIKYGKYDVYYTYNAVSDTANVADIK